MAADRFAYKNWTPGAWTPRRGAVWQAMPEADRLALEQWVEAEKRSGDRYPEELRVEDAQLLPVLLE